MKKKIVGTIESIEEIHELKSGMEKKGKWTLWGIKLITNANAYTLSGFNKKDLEEQLQGRAIGDMVEFEIEQNDKGYWNIATGSIKLAGQQTIHPIPKVEVKKLIEPEVPSIEILAEFTKQATSYLVNPEPIDSTAIFCKILECEYAWRTARYIQACKEKNMENFRR